MLAFIKSRLAAGHVPLMFTVRKMVFGTEAEFLYRVYHNSKTNCIKVAYNLSVKERKACHHAIAEHDLNLNPTYGTLPNQKRTRRKSG